MLAYKHAAWYICLTQTERDMTNLDGKLYGDTQTEYMDRYAEIQRTDALDFWRVQMPTHMRNTFDGLVEYLYGSDANEFIKDVDWVGIEVPISACDYTEADWEMLIAELENKAEAADEWEAERHHYRYENYM